MKNIFLLASFLAIMAVLLAIVDAQVVNNGGGGSAAAITPIGLTPYGAESGAGVVTSTVANQMSYSPILVSSPGWNVNTVAFLIDAATSAHLTACWYDNTGALLANGQGTTVVPVTSNVSPLITFTSLTLTPGSYFLALTSDSTTTQVDEGLAVNSWSIGIANAGKNSSNYAFFRGPTAANLSTGTSTLICPATAGTRIPVGFTTSGGSQAGGSAPNAPTMTIN